MNRQVGFTMSNPSSAAGCAGGLIFATRARRLPNFATVSAHAPS